LPSGGRASRLHGALRISVNGIVGKQLPRPPEHG
jgi:hypothetical protein